VAVGQGVIVNSRATMERDGIVEETLDDTVAQLNYPLPDVT
jgi:hypothetical protein